jgi:ribosome-associated translation inhibitor RaiA
MLSFRRNHWRSDMHVLIESSAPGATPGWRRQAEHRVRRTLHRLQAQVQQARVRVRDINGPKGGLDTRCQVVLTTAGHGTLVVVAQAAQPQAALNEALQRVTHALARLWQRKRRPSRPSETH